MKLATTTCDFDRFCDSYIDRIRYVSEAGFRHIDLSLYTIKEDDEFFYADNWRENVEKIKKFVKERGLNFVQAHSPNTNNLADFDDAVSKTVRSIKICGLLGIPNLVVHAGGDTSLTDRDIWFEQNRIFYKKLFPVMEENNVNVLCENTTKANMPSGYCLVTGKDMRDFVKYVNHPLFHACWDTGHANIEGAQYNEILDLGDELYAVHFNDNRGACDEHIIPFMGTMNVDEVMHALKDISFKGPLTFESNSVLRSQKSWFGDRHRFPKDTRLAEPTLELQKGMERFMYLTGEVILKAYNCFED